jgi:hypothetical protein
VTMSDLVSHEKFYIPQNRLTKSFDSNSLIGRKTTYDSRAINKDASIVRADSSRGHNPSGYEVPLPCLLYFGSVAGWFEPQVASLAVTIPSRSSILSKVVEADQQINCKWWARLILTKKASYASS